MADCDISVILKSAFDEAEVSLFKTPESLPALAKTGVVDSVVFRFNR